MSEVPGVLTHAPEIVEARIDSSSIISTQSCIIAIREGDSFFTFRFGTMYGGKTEGTLQDVEVLRGLRVPVHVFKLKGDNRYDTGDVAVASKNGNKQKATAISSIEEVSDAIESRVIKSGEVIAIIEIPFLCPDVETLNRFIELVKENNIIVIADGLGYWFNTQPLDIVRKILANSDLAFYMQAYNTFNPETLAEATLRCVRIAQVGGKIVVVDDDARYYQSLSQVTLEGLVSEFRKSRFCIEKITSSSVIDQSGIAVITYLPSHPSDKLFTIGGPERYIPISLKDIIELYGMLEIQFDPFQPQDLFINMNNVFRWETAGL